MLNFGFIMLNFGFIMLNFGFIMLNFGFIMLNLLIRVQPLTFPLKGQSYDIFFTGRLNFLFKFTVFILIKLHRFNSKCACMHNCYIYKYFKAREKKTNSEFCLHLFSFFLFFNSLIIAYFIISFYNRLSTSG